jgi:hypothetical protein
MATTQPSAFQDFIEAKNLKTKEDQKKFIRATLRETSRAVVEVSKTARLLAQTINAELETNLLDTLKEQATMSDSDLAILKTLI